ncbi:MAG: hypothetical protein IJ626_01770 [Muribaculaceae bacterium]|nr:hypothetical protein [Muribaculaceae bacterium]
MHYLATGSVSNGTELTLPWGGFLLGAPDFLYIVTYNVFRSAYNTGEAMDIALAVGENLQGEQRVQFAKVIECITTCEAIVECL